jgi:NAD(P)-dependent dehydrogenase (short-subunit alcohol dehydrogenase family)
MQNYFSLSGKRAIITGGAGHLGKVLGRIFLEYGADVVLADIVEADKAAAIPGDLEKNGRRPYYYKCNVANREEVEGLVEFGAKNLGGIDILINCARYAELAFAESLTDEQWDVTTKIDLYGSFYCSRGVFAHMKQKGGAIVNVASIAAVIGLPRGTTHYSAAKAGMLGMTRSLAVEWAKYKIRVNAVAPGQFDTEPLRELMKNEAFARDILSRIPMGRAGTCQEVALAVLYLASDASSFITGHTLVIDGGTTIS